MEQQKLAVETTSDSFPAPELWREAIQARVEGYRTRRGRRIEGAFSMRFPFPPTETSAPAPESESTSCELAENEPFAAAATLDSEVDVDHFGATPDAISGDFAPADVFPETNAVDAGVQRAKPFADVSIADRPAETLPSEAEFEPEPSPPRPRVSRKVIAFPKPASPQPVYRLADPVIPEQPRIMEVPEELQAFPATPLLDGLQFSAHEQSRPAAPADHIELPLQPVRVSQRVYAGVIDSALVLAATGVFGGVGFKLLPKLVLTKPLLLTAAALPVLLWVVYQYLFLMYGGRTAGMRIAGIRLRTFKGQAPSWRQRRSRVIGLYFSSASLMMGLLWALVDVDTLCWHDRISQTYMTAPASN